MGSLPPPPDMCTAILVLASVAILGLPEAWAQYSRCPESYGLQTYPHEGYCDKFYKCANGTLTEETCENGLVFDGHGSVHNHCNYNWGVDCGKRVYDDTPISSPGCLYQYGIYPVGEGCQTTFFKCAKGVAYETPCYQGLAYSPEKHVCDYPDNVDYCEKQSEGVVGFKCPEAHELPPNAVARRFLPSPASPSQEMRVPTLSVSTTTPGSTTVATTACSTAKPCPASTMRTSSSSPSLLAAHRVSAPSENRKYARFSKL
eukprot:TRINITY_DN16774_c0_g1_i1.p1 TRINITY_DN16774_c0_g1~~TRINITY_DN16774_c0_g1_i1.p1  ORF type:complete len:259 (+),score=50.92 TRINITY_DN16774_c0_g1_i1:236-1012(+)